MATQFFTSQTFADGDTLTGAKLNNIASGMGIYSAIITDQAQTATVGTLYELLISDTTSPSPNAITVYNLFNGAMSNGTYTNANISGVFTMGTTTGTRAVLSNATITTGTIPNLTSGTTTSTLAISTNSTATNGTIGTLIANATTSTSAIIPTLTAGTTTSTAATITTGTIPTLTTGTTTSTAQNVTNGTIQTLTSSTATISEIITTKNAAINVTTLGTASGTQNLDFSGQGYLTHSITGDITYTATNYAAGKSLTVRITADGTQRALAFPGTWTFVGTKPTAIAASKKAILSVTSFGATAAEAVAAYAVQT